METLKLRKRENRYWTITKDNDNRSVYNLHFIPFYDDTIILKFMQDKTDKDVYVYVSEPLGVEYDTIFADSIEDAMEQMEDMVLDHIENQISYYESLQQRWNE